ncbi:hypothetical protein EI001_17050, partial [Escherichia coli]|nr:hypothetical protein [Escherichia coli]
ADRNRSHWSTSKTPSYTKSVSWHHHQAIEQGNRCFENSELLISYITLSYRYNNKCQYAYRDAYYIIDIYCI